MAIDCGNTGSCEAEDNTEECSGDFEAECSSCEETGTCGEIEQEQQTEGTDEAELTSHPDWPKYENGEPVAVPNDWPRNDDGDFVAFREREIITIDGEEAYIYIKDVYRYASNAINYDYYGLDYPFYEDGTPQERNGETPVVTIDGDQYYKTIADYSSTPTSDNNLFVSANIAYLPIDAPSEYDEDSNRTLPLADNVYLSVNGIIVRGNASASALQSSGSYIYLTYDEEPIPRSENEVKLTPVTFPLDNNWPTRTTDRTETGEVALQLQDRENPYYGKINVIDVNIITLEDGTKVARPVILELSDNWPTNAQGHFIQPSDPDLYLAPVQVIGYETTENADGTLIATPITREISQDWPKDESGNYLSVTSPDHILPPLQVIGYEQSENADKTITLTPVIRTFSEDWPTDVNGYYIPVSGQRNPLTPFQVIGVEEIPLEDNRIWGCPR